MDPYADKVYIVKSQWRIIDPFLSNHNEESVMYPDFSSSLMKLGMASMTLSL